MSRLKHITDSVSYEQNYDTDLHLGDYPSPLQSFALGAGHAQEVPHYERSWPFPSKITGFKTLNTQGITVWETQEGVAEKKKEQNCLWAQHGVWGYDDHTNKPVVLKEGYFTKDGQGKDVNFYDDFYWPFVKRWEELISQGTGGKGMVHVEGVPNEVHIYSHPSKRGRTQLISGCRLIVLPGMAEGC